MDQIEKLLRKIHVSDRTRLYMIINKLLQGDTDNLDIKKIKRTDFYRVRSGRFRILFHYKGVYDELTIDSIKLRDEHTYKSI